MKKLSLRAQKRLANVLIGLGAVLFLAVGTYYLFTFGPLGWSEAETVEALADPSPLPSHLVREPVIETPTESPVASEESELAIDAPAWIFTPPEVDLVNLGSIKIPKISLSEHLVSGTGDELYYGVGHVTSTALPGQRGNCALAGHRNLIVAHPFRHLDKLAEGDEIYLTHQGETYCYVVYSSFIVEPSEGWVMNPQPGEDRMLTLVTCTPALAPTHRLIIWARCITDVADEALSGDDAEPRDAETDDADGTGLNTSDAELSEIPAGEVDLGEAAITSPNPIPEAFYEADTTPAPSNE